ncbi:MAG: flippase-like domain-containing protein [Lewinellaceae bacterium]|nr:flippase-like domain-containing protein [Lewinellaceae bacterium]
MMSAKTKKILQLVFFLGLGVTILVLLFRNLNTAYQEQCRLDGIPSDQCSLTDKLLNDFSLVSPWWMLMVVGAFTLSNMFRAWRWQMLLRPMGYEVKFSNSLLTILLGYFVNLGFPRAGEVARAGALARYEKIPLDKVMGTMVVDRLMDFICLGLVVGLAFLFEADTLLAFIYNYRAGSLVAPLGYLLLVAQAWQVWPCCGCCVKNYQNWPSSKGFLACWRDLKMGCAVFSIGTNGAFPPAFSGHLVYVLPAMLVQFESFPTHGIPYSGRRTHGFCVWYPGFCSPFSRWHGHFPPAGHGRTCPLRH